MAEFHRNPDGLVIVRTAAAIYIDTVDNFAADFGVELPALPAGVDDHVYTQGRRHAFMGAGDVVDGGPMPWLLGDTIIAAVGDGLAAQAARRNPPATLDQAIAAKDTDIESEFARLHQAPILHTVGGVEREFHADVEAVTNIMGVVLLINSGVPVPDPRPWTPRGSLTPVDVTHAELIGLGAAIASRKDQLFAAKKAKQAAVAAMADVAAVEAFDVEADWPSWPPA